MPIDITKVKLGKLKPKIDPRTLMFAKYFRAMELPTIPTEVDWTKGLTDFGMMMNDSLGDCAVAGMGHSEMIWTLNNDDEDIIPDSVIISTYSAISGYNPTTNTGDNGCALLDCLKYWQQTGIGGKKIGAYISVDPKNIAHVRAAIYIFGNVYTGFALPNSIQTQEIWDVPSEGFQGDGAIGSLGGHCVNIPKFNSNSKSCITWGKLQQMTDNFLVNYCDEMYAIVSIDFLTNNKAPNGFNLQQLISDLVDVTN
jgi:hypothetical protein